MALLQYRYNSNFNILTKKNTLLEFSSFAHLLRNNNGIYIPRLKTITNTIHTYKALVNDHFCVINSKITFFISLDLTFYKTFVVCLRPSLTSQLTIKINFGKTNLCSGFFEDILTIFLYIFTYARIFETILHIHTK